MDTRTLQFGAHNGHHTVSGMESLQSGPEALDRVRYTTQGSLQHAGVADLPIVFPFSVATRQAQEGGWSAHSDWGHACPGWAGVEARYNRFTAWQARDQGGSRRSPSGYGSHASRLAVSSRHVWTVRAGHHPVYTRPTTRERCIFSDFRSETAGGGHHRPHNWRTSVSLYSSGMPSSATTASAPTSAATSTPTRSTSASTPATAPAQPALLPGQPPGQPQPQPVLPAQQPPVQTPPPLPAPLPVPPVFPGYFPYQPQVTAPKSVFKAKMTAHFGGEAEDLGPFQIAVEQFLNRWGYQFASEAEIIELLFTQLDGAVRTWYVNLYKVGVPEMYSLAADSLLVE